MEDEFRGGLQRSQSENTEEILKANFTMKFRRGIHGEDSKVENERAAIQRFSEENFRREIQFREGLQRRTKEDDFRKFRGDTQQGLQRRSLY